MPHSIFTGRPVPAPGEQLFTREDTDLAVALAEEERDACPKCGMPRAFCREQEDARARWDVREDFCWVSFRLAQRRPKHNQDGSPSAVERATIVIPTVRPGYEMNLYAGLELDSFAETDGHGDDDGPEEGDHQ